ncbi:glycosyltransferase WbuB [Caulobacter sp. HMWF009]|nr:glycosyltransferase WbuB [Caulobacter sp. HMWF009]PTT09789.1 glycosyltransferase WbuB [Caulobacter sp. HMWF025]
MSMPDNRERLLLATRHYAPEPTGSAPVLQQLAEWLAGAGYAVETVTVRPSYPEAQIFPGYELGQKDNVVENGVQVLRLPTTAVGSKGMLARAIPESRFMIDLFLGRLTGAIKPSRLVVSLCPSILTVTGALALRSRGGRHVAIVHDIQSGLGAALGLGGAGAIIRVLRKVEAWTLNRVDSVVVLSEDMGRILKEIGVRTPMLVLPPHVDASSVRPMPKPEGAPPTLMYSGNLGRKQGLDQLLDMAVELKAMDPSVRIIIRGDGATKDSLIARAQAEGLSNVIFEPLVDRAKVCESMAEGDVHLVPQLPGGQEFAVPSKAFTIMAAGRPFVATAEAGSPLAQLADRSGSFVCVPPGDARAFAQACLDLLSQTERRQAMGAAGRDFVEREVDTPVVMERFRQLLV